jgi:acyl-CoA reductase-like NAD-dependent aldehyde dehydrogenase
MSFQAIDPTTGAAGRSFPTLDAEGRDAAITRAHDAFLAWREEPVAARCARLKALAARLRERRDALADLAGAEVGKPRAQALAEVDKCAWCAEHYAEAAPAALAPRAVATDAAQSMVVPSPTGVIYAIMPWNFPFWQLVRMAVPTLAAGNTVLLKHAPSVPGCAAALEDLFRDAGFPDGAMISAHLAPEDTAAVLHDPRVRGVALTGSTRAGRAVARIAGEALVPSVLELGGSDAAVVLADADLDRVVPALAAARLQNNGQSCIAAKRFIVEAAVYEAFVAALCAHLARTVVVGDPRDPATTVGPLARADLAAGLRAQVAASLAAGASLAWTSSAPDGPCFHPVQVLTGVTPGMPAFDDELFGPVAAVIRAEDADHAVALANGTVYGLGASVYSASAQAGAAIAARLDAGAVFVNGMVRSDPRIPFGGTKDSGWGRELGDLGLLSFCNLKTVWVS